MSIRLIKIGTLYLALGICLGLVMGASHEFTLAPVHAHLNLLGFATLTLAGLVYRAYPAAADTRLARWHFWLHNVGLPPLMVTLALMLRGDDAMAGPVGIFSMIVGAGVLLFIVNVWRTLRAEPTPVAGRPALRAS
jgi:cbb3-type cytochrome oxidase subunit 1